MIDQTITPIDTPLKRSDVTNTDESKDAFVASMETFDDAIPVLADELEAMRLQINDTETTMNALEASTVLASEVALAAANFQGTWVNQTTAVPQSWYYNGEVWGVLIPGNTSPVTSPSNWFPLSLSNQIHNATAKTTPTDTDEFGISDSATSFVLKKLTWANIKATLLSTFGAMINTAPAKTTPIDNDIFIIGDNAALNASKKLTWGNIKTALTALFAPVNSPIFTGTVSATNIAYKSAPVSITSWSYVGTTITLNVASHTFVAGDYIEVIGLTATTYPANGIQLVTSVTATTIVFTLSETPTGTAGVSSATVKGYSTINDRISESIGVNQTWKDLIASRALGVTYTNSTGKPIEVHVATSSASNQDSYFYINGVYVARALSSGSAIASHYMVVPNGATYSVTATATLSKWSELR